MFQIYVLDRQTNRQTDKQTDRQTDRQVGRWIDRQTGRQADRQAGRQTDRQAGRQTGRQADRLTGCVCHPQTHKPEVTPTYHPTRCPTNPLTFLHLPLSLRPVRQPLSLTIQPHSLRQVAAPDAVHQLDQLRPVVRRHKLVATQNRENLLNSRQTIEKALT